MCRGRLGGALTRAKSAQGCSISVDLVVGAECDKEALVARPAEEHTKVLIDAERPILAQLGLQLVRSQQPVVWICSEAAERGAQEFVARWPQLACSAEKPRGGDKAHLDVGSARCGGTAEFIEERVHILVGARLTRGVLCLGFANLP